MTTDATDLEVDDLGLTLPESWVGSYDVHLGDRHVWSFTRERGAGARVRWPQAMHAWLHGVGTLELRQGEEVVLSRPVRFGTGSEPIAFVDKDGIPVMVDKWGLVQRPFSGRGTAVVEEMVEISQQIIDVLARDLGLHAWIAFGSLLGAAREGGVITHDSDVDLAYLSDAATPEEMNREMYAVTRALRRHGMRVLNKSGSFVTVMYHAADGGAGSVDVYTCFYIGSHLHETATVRAEVPRSAIEPLQQLAFEGRSLPAPADPSTMLAVSYGPGWRVPDPSFKHQPSVDVVRRFDGWFGSLMKNRRDWERRHRETPAEALAEPTDFGRWVLDRVPADATVIDVGAGTGRDVLAAGRAGHRATGLDYARGCFGRASTLAGQEGLPVDFRSLNLYDPRDVRVRAAELAHDVRGPRVVLLGGVLDSLVPAENGHVDALLRMLVRPGDRVAVEVMEQRSFWRWNVAAGGRRFPVTYDEVVDRMTALGGDVLEVERLAARPDGEGEQRATRVRMMCRW